MKSLLIGIAAIVACAFGWHHYAHGQALDPPAKMTRAQADALYRIGNEAPRLQTKLNELIKEQAAIFHDLEVDPKLDQLNFDTLEITRSPRK